MEEAQRRQLLAQQADGDRRHDVAQRLIFIQQAATIQAEDGGHSQAVVPLGYHRSDGLRRPVLPDLNATPPLSPTLNAAPRKAHALPDLNASPPGSPDYHRQLITSVDAPKINVPMPDQLPKSVASFDTVLRALAAGIHIIPRRCDTEAMEDTDEQDSETFLDEGTLYAAFAREDCPLLQRSRRGSVRAMVCDSPSYGAQRASEAFQVMHASHGSAKLDIGQVTRAFEPEVITIEDSQTEGQVTRAFEPEVITIEDSQTEHHESYRARGHFSY